LDLIKSIPVPKDADTLSVEGIIENEFYASRNYDSYAGLLIKLNKNNNFPFVTYFSEALDIHVRDDCKIESDEVNKTVTALLIQPKIDNMDLVISSFADVILNYDFNKKVNLEDLNDYLSKLIQLFTYKTDDNFPLNSAVGLWGELLLISKFPEIVSYWKGSQGTTFDFQEKGISVEVKSSIKGKSFKINSKQLLANTDKSFLFAANIELDYDSGVSVTDLVEEIIRKIAIEYIFNFTVELSLRGFTIGHNISNLNKPFKLISDNPNVIDLNKLEDYIENTIQSISQCMEKGVFTQAEFSLNYAQIKMLENITYSDFSTRIEDFL